MKKIFFSLLAVAALASCTKTEPVFTEGNSEIKISPVAAMSTKAAIDGTTYPATEHFTVIGYWADQPAGTVNFGENPTVYLNNVTFAKQKDGQYWAGDGQSYYWPKNGSLRFAAYSPSSIEGMSHELATDTWSVKGYTQSNDTEKTIDFMVAQTPPSYTAQTAAENVSVVFEHALSWLTLKVKAEDEVASKAFTIKEVIINDVNTVADMDAAYPEKEWSNWSAPAAYTVFSSSKYSAEEPMPTEDAEIIENTTNGTVVIPQATTTVTITYTQNAINGSTQLDNQVITVPLALDENDAPWEPGKHYIYTLIFGLDEILINPSVADWEDVTVADKPVIELDNVTIAAGETYTLESDVVVGGSLKVAGTLDGAGNTIYAAAEPTDNGLIRPTDGAVIKNINVAADNQTTVDGKGTRGFYMTNGGNYVIENATVTGTAYAINITTTEAGTLKVTNSTLQGWTSYSNNIEAEFTNVKFTVGSYYAAPANSYSTNDNGLFRPYGNTTLVGCDFAEGFVIDYSQLKANGTTISFENCTYAGAAVSAEILAAHADGYDASVVTIK